MRLEQWNCCGAGGVAVSKHFYVNAFRILAVSAIASLLLISSPARPQSQTSAQQGEQSAPPVQLNDNGVTAKPASPAKQEFLGERVYLTQIDAVVTGKDGKFVDG